jgi:hypothetical protein
MRFSKISGRQTFGPIAGSSVARSYCCQTRMASTGARVLHRRLPRTAALGRPSEHSVCECEAPPADPVRVQPSLCHYLSAREMGNDASTKSSRAYVQLALPPTLTETELDFLYCPLARDTQFVDKFFSVVRKSIRVHAPLERNFLTQSPLLSLIALACSSGWTKTTSSSPASATRCSASTSVVVPRAARFRYRCRQDAAASTAQVCCQIPSLANALKVYDPRFQILHAAHLRGEAVQSRMSAVASARWRFLRAGPNLPSERTSPATCAF